MEMAATVFLQIQRLRFRCRSACASEKDIQQDQHLHREQKTSPGDHLHEFPESFAAKHCIASLRERLPDIVDDIFGIIHASGGSQIND
jgi:hypothetical protein